MSPIEPPSGRDILLLLAITATFLFAYAVLAVR
jgi:hypothetical protein